MKTREWSLPRPITELLKEDVSIPRTPVLAKFFRCARLCENAPENRMLWIMKYIKENTSISMLELSKLLKVNHKTESNGR
ncbi:MAG: hypothetical protein LBQ04_03525 [Endomicrobium sp.]|nr:hypothetical protein [Endomicrobium sp.]